MRAPKKANSCYAGQQWDPDLGLYYLGQLLGYETFSKRREACLLQPNIQTAWPPRTAVPVNTAAWLREFLSPQHARFAFGNGCDYPSYNRPCS
jgi:hypothetical protein